MLCTGVELCVQVVYAEVYMCGLCTKNVLVVLGLCTEQT